MPDFSPTPEPSLGWGYEMTEHELNQLTPSQVLDTLGKFSQRRQLTRTEQDAVRLVRAGQTPPYFSNLGFGSPQEPPKASVNELASKSENADPEPAPQANGGSESNQPPQPMPTNTIPDDLVLMFFAVRMAPPSLFDEIDEGDTWWVDDELVSRLKKDIDDYYKIRGVLAELGLVSSLLLPDWADMNPTQGSAPQDITIHTHGPIAGCVVLAEEDIWAFQSAIDGFGSPHEFLFDDECPIGWRRIFNDSAATDHGIREMLAGAHWPAGMDDRETVAEWVKRTRLTSQRIQEIARINRLYGGDVRLLINHRDQNSKLADTNSRIEFVIDGLIPKGMVAVLAGAAKVGKSTLLTELACAVAAGEGEWAGQTVNPDACDGLVFYVSGEDPGNVVATRMEQMGFETQGGTDTPYVIPTEGRSLDEILALLEGCNIALFIFDPAIKGVRGNENEADAVSRFFAALEDFAARTGAAVVIAHHTGKGGAPKTINEVSSRLRGSSVYGDRPRVQVAVARRGEVSTLGIPSPNGVPRHNMPPTVAMLEGQVSLTLDPKTGRHVVVGTQPRSASDSATSDEPADDAADRVLAAVVDIVAAGGRVTRTGPNGVYQQTKAVLGDLKRADIEGAADALLADGRLTTDSSRSLIPASGQAG